MKEGREKRYIFLKYRTIEEDPGKAASGRDEAKQPTLVPERIA